MDWWIWVGIAVVVWLVVEGNKTPGGAYRGRRYYRTVYEGSGPSAGPSNGPPANWAWVAPRYENPGGQRVYAVAEPGSLPNGQPTTTWEWAQPNYENANAAQSVYIASNTGPPPVYENAAAAMLTNGQPGTWEWVPPNYENPNATPFVYTASNTGPPPANGQPATWLSPLVPGAMRGTGKFRTVTKRNSWFF
jgi:hypothetical protein